MFKHSHIAVPACLLCPLIIVLLGSGLHSVTSAEEGQDLAAQLRDLNTTVISPDSDKGKELPKMLSSDARSRIRAANQRETKAWKELRSKADWEKYRDPRIAALRQSLGQPVEVPKELKVRVTRT